MSDRETSSPCLLADGTLPSPRRRLAVNLFLAIFFLGSACSLIAQRDFWPFSPYPMFATLQQPEIQILEVVGLTGDAKEIPLAPSRRTSLVAGTRYQVTLDRLVTFGSESELHAFLTGVARRHERASGGTLTLRSVRLYRSRWEAVAGESPPARRAGRELLSELNLTR